MSQNEDQYVQCFLKGVDTELLTTMWLNKPDSFKKHSVISLKGETERWMVLRKGNMRLSKDELHTDWNVGGLERER